MPVRIRPLATVLMLSAALALSGCESPEEKAERFYQSGMALLAAGDEERALIEFRNVFENDGFHKEARKTYADVQLRRGEVAEAYSQYLRLIEQYPDMVEVREILAGLAISRNDWEEAERHGKAAIELAPDRPAVRAIAAALDYRTAVMAEDEAGSEDAYRRAEAILAETPDDAVARRIVIDRLANSADPLSAMPQIDRAIAADPRQLEYQALKFRLLAEANDVEGTGTQLRAMFEQFPANEEVRTALITWYMTQRDFDGAEAFLREIAGEDTGAPEGHLAVVQLLQAARGPEAAKTELERLVTANQGTPNADLYRAMAAVIDYQAGRQAEAVAALEDILKTAQPTDQTRRIKIMLAQLLADSGNQVGARARVEEVLVEDPTNTDALKLRAGWLIAEDRPGDAIVDLRAALGQDSRDPEILTLMAEAHERDGSPELAGERLALAVEVSNAAPEESLRYARFLTRQGRSGPAEAVLVDSLRANPESVEVLAGLADLRLANRDWPRVEEVVASLRAIGTADATAAAQGIEASLLAGQNRTDESIAFLQRQVAEGMGDATAVAMIVQTQVRSGRLDEARAYLDEAMKATPDDPDLRLLSGAVYGLQGQNDRAEEAFRALIDENPGAEPPVRMLYGLLMATGRTDDAGQVIDAALEKAPGSGLLRWMKAGHLEQTGDIDGAIAIFEQLYAEDSTSEIVANNLASLITTYRTDPESLERAYVIARRLNGSNVPAFQDTYGWIQYRRGNLEEALANLEPAAAGLPDDPLVQFHLGMTYAGLKRTGDARRTLTRALELWGESTLPQAATARETLDALPKEG